MVGCFGFNGPLRQYFSLYRAVSQREGERREMIDERKNVQTPPTRTYCKRNRPLPYCYQNCRTPRHWKFTQDHRTTRPPSDQKEVVLVVLAVVSLTECKQQQVAMPGVLAKLVSQHILLPVPVLGLLLRHFPVNILKLI